MESTARPFVTIFLANGSANGSNSCLKFGPEIWAETPKHTYRESIDQTDRKAEIELEHETSFARRS